MSTSESVMSSLNLNYATGDRASDKITSKWRPVNNYVVEPSQDDLTDMFKIHNSATNNRYAIYQSELKIMRNDVERLKAKLMNYLRKNIRSKCTKPST